MSPETAARSKAETMDANMVAFVTSLPRHAHWLPRIGVAAIFLYHGFDHWRNVEAFGEMFGLGTTLAFVVAYIEVASAALLVLGAPPSRYADGATRVGGLLMIPPMLGAIAKTHWPRWDFAPSDAHPMGGMEFQVFMIALGLFFFLRGHPAAPAERA